MCQPRGEEQHRVEERVEEFSLEPFALYEGNAESKDNFSPHVLMSSVFGPQDVPKLEAAAARGHENVTPTLGSLQVVAGAPLKRKSIVLVSPIKLASRVKPGYESEVKREDLCAALVGLAVQKGLMNRTSENFREDIRTLFESLWPRDDDLVHDIREFYLLLNRKVLTNAFQGRGEWTATLMLGGSFFNHSCAPNCAVRITPDMRGEFYLIRDVTAQEELRVSYIPFPIDSKAARARLLGMRFTCNCAYCEHDWPPSHALLDGDKMSSDRKHCWWCGSTAFKLSVCSGCAFALYCSKSCQRTNWSQHKLICAKLK